MAGKNMKMRATHDQEGKHLARAAGTSKRGGRRARMSRATAAIPSSLLLEASEPPPPLPPPLLLVVLLTLLADDVVCSSIIDSKNMDACALFDVSAALSCRPNSAGDSVEGNFDT